jgi:hypothetical protein
MNPVPPVTMIFMASPILVHLLKDLLAPFVETVGISIPSLPAPFLYQLAKLSSLGSIEEVWRRRLSILENHRVDHFSARRAAQGSEVNFSGIVAQIDVLFHDQQTSATPTSTRLGLRGRRNRIVPLSVRCHNTLQLLPEPAPRPYVAGEPDRGFHDQIFHTINTTATSVDTTILLIFISLIIHVR